MLPSPRLGMVSVGFNPKTRHAGSSDGTDNLDSFPTRTLGNNRKVGSRSSHMYDNGAFSCPLSFPTLIPLPQFDFIIDALHSTLPPSLDVQNEFHCVCVLCSSSSGQSTHPHFSLILPKKQREPRRRCMQRNPATHASPPPPPSSSLGGRIEAMGQQILGLAPRRRHVSATTPRSSQRVRATPTPNAWGRRCTLAGGKCRFFSSLFFSFSFSFWIDFKKNDRLVEIGGGLTYTGLGCLIGIFLFLIWVV